MRPFLALGSTFVMVLGSAAVNLWIYFRPDAHGHQWINLASAGSTIFMAGMMVDRMLTLATLGRDLQRLRTMVRTFPQGDGPTEAKFL